MRKAKLKLADLLRSQAKTQLGLEPRVAWLHAEAFHLYTPRSPSCRAFAHSIPYGWDNLLSGAARGIPPLPSANSLKYLPWWPQVKKNMPLLWTSTALCNRSWYLQLSPGGNKFVHCSCLGSVHLTCLMYLTPSSTPWTSTNLCSQYLCNK